MGDRSNSLKPGMGIYANVHNINVFDDEWEDKAKNDLVNYYNFE